MKPIVVDTSTLITLALANDEKIISRTSTAEMHAKYGAGLDGAISALVLYEDLLLDHPSITRNTKKLPSLERIRGIATMKEVEIDEEAIYRVVGEQYLPKLDPHAHLSGLALLEADVVATSEFGTSRFGPAPSWREVEAEMTGAAADVARSLREIFGATGPASGAACATLLRTFYYDYLQQIAGADLIIHPAKAAIREAKFGPPVRILDAFDKEVRTAFAERRKRWLGEDAPDFDVPLLTQYVLERCSIWSDLPEIVGELRNSKRAAEFRRGVSDMVEAAASRKGKLLNTELEHLDAARIKWQRELGISGVTKKLSLSLPLLPIATDLEVRDLKLNPKPADKVLSFVHLLLTPRAA